MKNSIACTNSNWNTINRPDDVYYSLDPIVRVKGVGAKKGEALVSSGITCVGDLRTLVDDEVKRKEVVAKTAGVGIKFIFKLLSETSNTITGARESVGFLAFVLF